MYFLTALETRSQKSSFWQICAPYKKSRKDSFLFLASGSRQQPLTRLAYGCITPVSASVFTWPSLCCSVSKCLCFCKTLILIQYDFIVTLLHLQGPYFQLKSHSQVLAACEFWEDCIELSTCNERGSTIMGYSQAQALIEKGLGNFSH